MLSSRSPSRDYLRILPGLLGVLAIGIFTVSILPRSDHPATLMAGLLLVGAVLFVFIKDVTLFGTLAAGLYALTQTFLVNTRLFEIGGMEINAARLAIPLVSVLLLSRLGIEALARRESLVLPSFLVPYLGFVALTFLGLYWTRMPEQGLANASRVATSLVAILFGYYAAKWHRKIRPFEYLLVFVSVTAGVSTLLTYAAGIGPEAGITRGAIRVGGTIQGAVASAIATVLALPVFVEWIEKRSDRPILRVIGIVGIVIIGLALFASFTRRAQLTAVLFLLGFAFSRGGEARTRGRAGTTRRRAFIALLALSALIAGLFFVDTETLTSRIHDIPIVGQVEGLEDSTGSGRGRIWESVITSLSYQPWWMWLTGHGTADTLAATLAYGNWSRNAHNSFLEVLHNHGLPGLVLFSIFILMLLRRLRSVARSDTPAAPKARLWFIFFLAYVLVVDMFGSDVYFIGTRYFLFVMLGALLGWSDATRPAADRGSETLAAGAK